MKTLLKRFLKPTRQDPFNLTRFTLKPIAPWKKNTFAIFIGLGIGLYIGQYFPDIFFPKVEPYLPEIQQLKELAPKMQDKKPNPIYPKSLFDYPKDATIPQGQREDKEDQEYIVINDVTKKAEKIKVKRVFRSEDKD